MRLPLLPALFLPVLACSPAAVPQKASDPVQSEVASKALPKAPASKPQFEWIRVEGGSFQMGHPQVSSSLNAQVKVDTFEITKSEVTVEQYRVCVDAGKCTAPHADCEWNSYEMGDLLPVNCVTPDQAAQFATFAGARIPTEAEWEYAACNRGEQTLFPWGDLGVTAERAVGGAPAKPQSKPSILRPKAACSALNQRYENKLGLCDMGSGVAEWVVPGADLAGEKDLVSRGGSDHDAPLDRACAARQVIEKGYWGNGEDAGKHASPTIGIRLVRDVK